MLTGGQVVAFVLADLAIILVVARLCGAAARRLGQPGVVGEIIAGVLLGPSLLGAQLGLFADPPAWLLCQPALAGTTTPPSVSACLFPPQAQAALNVIGQLALLLFMFLAGLQLDFSRLRGREGKVTAVALGAVVVPVLVAFLISPLLYVDAFVPDFGTDAAPSRLAFTVFLAAVISVTALPVMVRILQEEGLETSDLGVVGISASAIVTVLMFVLVSLAVGIADRTSAGVLALRGVLVVVYLAAMVFVVRPLVQPLERAYLARARAREGAPQSIEAFADLGRHDPSGAGWILSPAMFGWIIVGVLLSGWVAHLLGLTVIVGGFMAGAVLPARAALVRDLTTELFQTTVVVLLPVFLAFSGLRTDFSALTVGALGGIAILLIACIVAKWGAGVAIGRAVGLGRQSNALGWLLNCRGLLPLVVALIGMERGVLTPPMQVAIVVMALVTTMMTGPLVNRALRSTTV